MRSRVLLRLCCEGHLSDGGFWTKRFKDILTNRPTTSMQVKQAKGLEIYASNSYPTAAVIVETSHGDFRTSLPLGHDDIKRSPPIARQVLAEVDRLVGPLFQNRNVGPLQKFDEEV